MTGCYSPEYESRLSPLTAQHSSMFDSLAPARLKLVRVPALSLLPIAALPSMSLSPKAPFDLSACPSVSLASPRLHSIAGGEKMK
jgi:hypothetical protein